MKLKTSKKKLTASLILFIIALIGFAVGIFFLATGLSSDGEINYLAVEVPLVAFVILIIISALLNRSYRKNCIVAGVLSTVLYVFQIIFLLPFLIIGFIVVVYALMHVGGSQGEEQLKKIKVTDEDGNVYILTQLYAGSVDYKDQHGDIWTTRDGGITFECISNVRAKDKYGDEYNLKPNSEFASTDYTDQNGDTWQKFDTFGNGATYERKPKVKDAAGNEYELTKTSEFGDLYTDQYGGWWKSWDGGNTFEKY